MKLRKDFQACTSHGVIRICSVALSVFMIGFIYILYSGVSSKMPVRRLVARRVGRRAPEHNFAGLNLPDIASKQNSFPEIAVDHEEDRDTGGLEDTTEARETTIQELSTTRKPSADEMTMPSASTANNKTVHILLNAYHRSGSSFTGNMLASQPDAFYYFEPLIKIGDWGHFPGGNLLCNDLTGKCRRLNGWSRELNPLHNYMKRYNISETESFEEILYHLLLQIYECQLLDTEDLIVEGITDSFTDSLRRLWYSYGLCRKWGTIHDCLPVVTDSCQKSRVRVIKLVRLSLDIAAPLLERDHTLKLVHLFRDPRGIICSRLVKTRWYPLRVDDGDYTPIRRNAEILCSRMLQDYMAGVELIKKFPNRVKLIRYEDLNEDYSFSVKKELLQFLSLSSKEYLQKSKKGSSNDWMTALDWEVIDIVDSVCPRVYEKLGYIKLDYISWRENRAAISFVPKSKPTDG